MAISVVVPAAGESVTEGRIARWMVADGSAVKLDQSLFEIETDKASAEVPAPIAGVIKIGVKAGEIVKVGATVATIDPAGTPSVTSVTPTVPKPASVISPGLNDPLLSPAARAMVADASLDASKIAATGPGGRVTKDDVLNHQSSASKSSSLNPESKILNPAQRETRTPMSMIRRRIAERLLESQNTTATLTTFNEADMSAIQDLRAKYNEKFEKKNGTKLGFMSVFVKATVEALKAFPLVNARIDGTDVVHQHFYDIGVAVSTEKGLMVPIIRDADRLGFADIEKAIADVAKRARDGKVNVAELQGGTFGSMISTPILNPPQSAILGMHSIQKRAVVVNDQIVVRPMMYLALSYDHRIVDGREAVQFLVRIKYCVENPERLLLGV